MQKSSYSNDSKMTNSNSYNETVISLPTIPEKNESPPPEYTDIFKYQKPINKCDSK